MMAELNRTLIVREWAFMSFAFWLLGLVAIVLTPSIDNPVLVAAVGAVVVLAVNGMVYRSAATSKKPPERWRELN